MEDHVGARVRRVRLWRGITQKQLADLAGWTMSAVSMLETGRRGLDSRQRLAQLADALQVAPAELLGEPYPLDTPGLADALSSVPALERALMEVRIGSVAGVEPRPVAELAEIVRGPLWELRVRADDGARLRLLPDLLIELQAHGRDEAALRLLTVAAAEASHTLRHVGQIPLAWIAAERAAEAAAVLGDPVVVAEAEFVRALSRSSAPAVLARAGVAADQMPTRLVDRDPHAQEVYGMLQLTAALGEQVRGDLSGALGHVDEAARVAELHGEVAGAWGYFGPANVEVWRIALLVESGEPARALTAAAKVDPDGVPPERRAALWLDMARAHHQMGRAHHQQAVAALRQAEKLASVRIRASPWARDLVEVMLGEARREAGGRELRGLALRMGLDP